MTCRGTSITVWFKCFIRRNLISLSISINLLISAATKLHRKLIFQIWVHSRVNLKYSTERGRGHEITQLRKKHYHVTKIRLSVSSPQPPEYSHPTQGSPCSKLTEESPEESVPSTPTDTIPLEKIFGLLTLKWLNLGKRTTFTLEEIRASSQIWILKLLSF